MTQYRTTYVIIASTLALIALFFFQVHWMRTSHDLIEEQFNQKVSMALCFAVESLNKDTTNEVSPGCSPVEILEDKFQLVTAGPYDREEIDKALEMAMGFYDIELAYKVDILDKTCVTPDKDKPFCCTLNPLQMGESDQMSVAFPDKDEYIFRKMKFMLLSSIIILVFVTLVFVFANYTLWKQKQIQQINKDFFNNMAHEFNTPLTNITLANKLLLRNYKDLTDNRFVKIVQQETGKLKAQVERVLHLGKLENGEYQLEKQALNIGQLLQGVIKGMDMQIQQKNAVIELDVPPEIPLVMGDKFHLGNAFRNIIDNSLKYSPNAPRINISLKNHKDGLLILFQDSGHGIAKKEQVFVFDKYHRASNGDRHDQKGFGLGLSYVKMIVERHQGAIKVISELNKGCRFDLFIPIN